MPAARINTVADAIVTKLNAHTFSKTFTAFRQYESEEEYTESSDTSLQVPVVPGSRDDELSGRCTDTISLVVDVGIIKRLTVDATARKGEIDDYMYLVEEVTEYLAKRSNRDLGNNYAIQQVSIDPLYSTDHLRQLNVFLAVIRVKVTKGIVVE